jgi:hypothetical protein
MSERDDDELGAASEEERAAAEALARDLEGGRPPSGAPAETLAAAALLRAAARPGLDAAGLDRAAARARSALETRRTAAPRKARPRWLLAALLAPAAAAAAALLFVGPSARLEPPRTFPLPSPALLEAQARATRGRPDLTTLDAEMRDYRAAYYAALAEERP